MAVRADRCSAIDPRKVDPEIYPVALRAIKPVVLRVKVVYLSLIASQWIVISTMCCISHKIKSMLNIPAIISPSRRPLPGGIVVSLLAVELHKPIQ